MSNDAKTIRLHEEGKRHKYSFNEYRTKLFNKEREQKRKDKDLKNLLYEIDKEAERKRKRDEKNDTNLHDNDEIVSITKQPVSDSFSKALCTVLDTETIDEFIDKSATLPPGFFAEASKLTSVFNDTPTGFYTSPATTTSDRVSHSNNAYAKNETGNLSLSVYTTQSNDSSNNNLYSAEIPSKFSSLEYDDIPSSHHLPGFNNEKSPVLLPPGLYDETSQAHLPPGLNSETSQAHVLPDPNNETSQAHLPPGLNSETSQVNLPLDSNNETSPANLPPGLFVESESSDKGTSSTNKLDTAKNYDYATGMGLWEEVLPSNEETKLQTNDTLSTTPVHNTIIKKITKINNKKKTIPKLSIKFHSKSLTIPNTKQQDSDAKQAEATALEDIPVLQFKKRSRTST